MIKTLLALAGGVVVGYHFGKTSTACAVAPMPTPMPSYPGQVPVQPLSPPSPAPAPVVTVDVNALRSQLILRAQQLVAQANALDAQAAAGGGDLASVAQSVGLRSAAALMIGVAKTGTVDQMSAYLVNPTPATSTGYIQ